MKRATSAALICALVLLSACGEDDDSVDGAVNSTTPAESVEAPPTGNSAALDRASSCALFLETITDFTLSDAESAAMLQMLADRTSEPQLANAIRSVAAAFARSDPEIYSTDVDALCE